MSQIRERTIINPEMTGSEKDSYMLLARRLGRKLSETGNQFIDGHVTSLRQKIGKDEATWSYDPVQDIHWRKKDRKFVSSLEELLVAIVFDDFHTLDAKHHLMQAIKYLESQEPYFAEKEDAIFDTILPYLGGVPLDNRKGGGKKFLDYMFSTKYEVERKDPSTILVGADPKILGSLINEARDMGYSNMQIVLSKKFIEKKMKDAKIIEDHTDQKQNDILLAMEKTNSIFHNMLNKLPIPIHQKLSEVYAADKPLGKIVRSPKYLIYPILGSLPKSSQEKLSRAYPEYDKKKAFYSSLLGTTIAASVGGLVVIVEGAGLAVGIGLVTLGYTDFLTRMFLSHRRDPYGLVTFSSPSGSVFGIPLWMAEKGFIKDPEDFALVELPLRESPETTYKKNPIEYYQGICELEIPKSIEEKLVKDAGNYHTYAEGFLEHIKSNLPLPEQVSIETIADRDQQSVIYHHELKTGTITKYISLVCQKGKRHIVTAITSSELKDAGRKITSVFEENKDHVAELQKIYKTPFVKLTSYNIQQKEVENKTEEEK